MEGPQLPGWMRAGCALLSQKGQFLGWEEEALWQSGQNHFGPWLVTSILRERLTIPLLSIPVQLFPLGPNPQGALTLSRQRSASFRSPKLDGTETAFAPV